MTLSGTCPTGQLSYDSTRSHSTAPMPTDVAIKPVSIRDILREDVDKPAGLEHMFEGAESCFPTPPKHCRGPRPIDPIGADGRFRGMRPR